MEKPAQAIQTRLNLNELHEIVGGIDFYSAAVKAAQEGNNNQARKYLKLSGSELNYNNFLEELGLT
jgi:hypothetical protein